MAILWRRVLVAVALGCFSFLFVDEALATAEGGDYIVTALLKGQLAASIAEELRKGNIQATIDIPENPGMPGMISNVMEKLTTLFRILRERVDPKITSAIGGAALALGLSRILFGAVRRNSVESIAEKYLRWEGCNAGIPFGQAARDGIISPVLLDFGANTPNVSGDFVAQTLLIEITQKRVFKQVKGLASLAKWVTGVRSKREFITIDVPDECLLHEDDTVARYAMDWVPHENVLEELIIRLRTNPGWMKMTQGEFALPKFLPELPITPTWLWLADACIAMVNVYEEPKMEANLKGRFRTQPEYGIETPVLGRCVFESWDMATYFYKHNIAERVYTVYVKVKERATIRPDSLGNSVVRGSTLMPLKRADPSESLW